MAEVVKVPVELTGLEKLNTQLSKQMSTTYRTLFVDIQKAQTQLNQVIESGIRAQFPETGKARGRGKFKVTTPVDLSIAADLAAGLPAISGREIPFTSTVDLDKENRERIKKGIHEARMRRRTNSLAGFNEAIKEQEKLVKELQDSLKEELIPPSVVQAAEKELKALVDRREKFAAFMQKGKTRETIRRTTESYKKAIDRVRSAFSDDTLGLSHQAEQMRKIADAVTKPEERGTVSPEFARRVRREARSVQKKYEQASAREVATKQREEEQATLEGNRLREVQAKQEAKAKKAELSSVQQQTAARKKARAAWLADVENANKQLIKTENENYQRQRRFREDYLMEVETANKELVKGLKKKRIEEAKAKKAQARQTRDAERERQRSMSQATMGMASVGIGLFGQAGFPLLNVAFASMSGMKYAGMAGVATAIGEVVRGLMRLQDTARQSADSLNFVTKSFKQSKAEMDVMSAIYGGMLEPGQERATREKIKALTRMTAGAQMWRFAGNARSNISSSWTNPLQWNLFSFLTGRDPFSRARRQTQEDIANEPAMMRERLENMRRQMGAFNATFESPEAVWRRIQQAAASRGDEAAQMARKQLEFMEKQVRALEENTRALNNSSPPMMYGPTYNLPSSTYR